MTDYPLEEGVLEGKHGCEEGIRSYFVEGIPEEHYWCMRWLVYMVDVRHITGAAPMCIVLVQKY